MAKKIKIKYLDEDIVELVKTKKGDFIDLRAAETVELKKGDYALIPLGVAMQLPKGYMAKVYPRSSTFKNFGVIQANSVGVIDADYCGDKDYWMYPVIAMRDTVINKNDRICQFEICKVPPKIKFERYAFFMNESRGGFGSTGVN